MVRLRLDLMIFEALSNLSNSLILYDSLYNCPRVERGVSESCDGLSVLVSSSCVTSILSAMRCTTQHSGEPKTVSKLNSSEQSHMLKKRTLHPAVN